MFERYISIYLKITHQSCAAFTGSKRDDLLGWILVAAVVEADLAWEGIVAVGCTEDIDHRAAVVVAAAWEVCHLVAVVAASEVFVVPTEIASEDLVPVVHHLLGCVDMAGCNQVLERSLVFGHPLDLLVLLLVDPAAAVDNSEDIGLEGQVCHIREEEVHLDVLPEEAVHRNYLMNIPDHPD